MFAVVALIVATVVINVKKSDVAAAHAPAELAAA
jgi:hypothetical protein